ncbi:unnamed protein product [Heligmosomoides polygyrus]|uniref:DUF1758 domain-containing protein n=1 Tax=Heligmosomoides polygyrus TaxID=6339 RepID=A0A183GAV0_HELPZ|nr:unnamed protein product [Heligmosomoides polygyrus]
MQKLDYIIASREKYEDSTTLEETIISSSAAELRAGTDIAPPPEILAAEATSVAVETTKDTVRQNDRCSPDRHSTSRRSSHYRSQSPSHVDSVGKDLVVELTTKEVVTLPQQPPSLADEDVQFIPHHAFDLPACRSESVLPDILIGINYYWDILSPEAPICFPSGMILSHTRPDPIDTHAADEFSNDETIQRLWSLDALGIVDDHNPSMDSNASCLNVRSVRQRILSHARRGRCFICGGHHVDADCAYAEELQGQYHFCHLDNHHTAFCMGNQHAIQDVAADRWHKLMRRARYIARKVHELRRSEEEFEANRLYRLSLDEE